MLLSLLSRGDFKSFLISMLLSLPVIFFALSVHESAHGLVASWMGDRTARNLGRITLNPLKHLDPMGFISMLLFGIGWAKPVPINSRNFRNPKWGFVFSSLAGPLSNFLLGIINALLYGFVYARYIVVLYQSETMGSFHATLLYWLAQFFLIGAMINFIYSVFNMIPVPPYDGSRILFAFLPTKTYFAVMRYERQIMMVMLLVIFLVAFLSPVSPFSWVAEKLTTRFAEPIFRLVLKNF